METPQQKQWREDPNNWKWGMFYFNPEDKRLMPPKYIKEMGWTVNFANPKSILAMMVLLGFFGFVIYMIQTHRVN